MSIEWRGFELHPETPPGGVPLTRLFPAARIPAMAEHLKRFSASFGIEPIAPRAHLANTRRSLAIAEYARDLGKLDAFREAASRAYWREDNDLESDTALGTIAAHAGLDVDAALAAASNPQMLARVDATRREASRLGIDGIPTFVVNGRRVVVGCQPYEIIAEAVELEGSRRSAKPG